MKKSNSEKESISKARLLNDPRITANGSTKLTEALFNILTEAAFSDKSHFNIAGKKTYQCPPYFSNIFIIIANYYKTDDYKRIRKTLKYFDSAPIEDVEFLFHKIISSETLKLPQEQQERLYIVHSILLKLCSLNTARINTLNTLQKEHNIDIKKYKKQFLSYIVDQDQTTIFSMDANKLDKLLNQL